MNTNHLTLNKPILIDVCHIWYICHNFLSPRFMEGLSPVVARAWFFPPRRTVSKSLGQADCGGNEWLGSEAHSSGVGTVDGTLAWKPVEGKVIPLYKGWHPRWLAGFFFPSTAWIVWTWKISHDSVSSLSWSFIRKRSNMKAAWMNSMYSDTPRTGRPSSSSGGGETGKHYKNRIRIPQESMVKMCAVV